MAAHRFGRYFDEFTVGEVFEHALTKTITESDNNLFSLITMNHHPVHLDDHYAKSQHHGQILVVGTLVFSLVVGISVSDVSGTAIANLGYEDVKHLNPVFIGDTLSARTEVLSAVESKSNSDRGIVYVETMAFNQRNESVISFRRHVLVKKK